MRNILLSILGFFMLANVFAQGIDTAHKDASKRFMIVDTRPLDTSVKPLVVVDGQIYTRSLERINPKDILEISILKGTEAETIYGSGGINGVVIITTKLYAISQYQQKLRGLSKQYDAYLKLNKNDDSELLYVLNGEPLEMTAKGGGLEKLYEIPLKKIESVTFMDKYYKGTFNNNKPLILIKTKD